MIIPKSYEELAGFVEKGKTMLFFTADWCGDCVFIKPSMPEIEADFPEYQFVQVDRDGFIDICQKWDIFGIPSFVAIDDGQELGRFVSKNRKTKKEIEEFITSL
ncbi:thioredoxin family protein [Vagococcus vulneris]|uniref:Thiol reductase thioredoxin n=1 Tax=Vagococcus vulneris TaxID=1977869 RepID=A0A429ZWB4_9ENTE|nr:thioredoxin family protein [Vagococcus vulneris]RST98110.1 thiol reductase thioredoxin [Vagococcus vulneris]